MAEVTSINGKVLGGDSGEGVLIERVDVSYDIDSKGEPRTNIVLSGTAKTVLKSSQDKEAGFDELPAEVPILLSIPFSVTGGAVKSNQITYDQLNKAFGLLGEDALVDREGEWERFLEDDPRSVKGKIEGQRLHFKASLKKDKDTGNLIDETVPFKAENYFFNPYPMKQFLSNPKDIRALMAALKEKAAAKNAGI